MSNFVLSSLIGVGPASLVDAAPEKAKEEIRGSIDKVSQGLVLGPGISGVLTASEDLPIEDLAQTDLNLRKDYQEQQRQLIAANQRRQRELLNRQRRIRRATVRQAAFSSGVSGSSSAVNFLANIETQAGADTAFQSANQLFSDVMTDTLQEISDVGVRSQIRQEALQQRQAMEQFAIDLGLTALKTFATGGL